MVFTVNDVHDLTQVLTLHPEWLGEVRRLVLTEELLALPDLVRELAQTQSCTEMLIQELAQAEARSEKRLDHLDATMQKLAEAQARTEMLMQELAQAEVRSEKRLDHLDATVQNLVEAQVRTEARLEALTASIDALTASVDALTARVDALTVSVQDLVRSQGQIVNTMGGMKGRLLEITYRERAVSYFGRLLRRPRVVSMNDLWDTLENRLSKLEFDDLLALDLLVQGRPREHADMDEVWLAIEVSSVVDQGDVERSQRRAALLRKAGYRAVPLVAGDTVTQGASEMLQDAPVVLLLDGSSDGWEVALAASG